MSDVDPALDPLDRAGLTGTPLERSPGTSSAQITHAGLPSARPVRVE
ncbi:MAG TPA: hypothetical protein VF940_23160 [Streptosporangiaceae bacterium]